jgi:hypothetical protein
MEDLDANDGLFGVIINNCSNSIDYYLSATVISPIVDGAYHT